MIREECLVVIFICNLFLCYVVPCFHSCLIGWEIWIPTGGQTGSFFHGEGYLKGFVFISFSVQFCTARSRSKGSFSRVGFSGGLVGFGLGVLGTKNYHILVLEPWAFSFFYLKSGVIFLLFLGMAFVMFILLDSVWRAGFSWNSHDTTRRTIKVNSWYGAVIC